MFLNYRLCRRKLPPRDRNLHNSVPNFASARKWVRIAIIGGAAWGHRNYSSDRKFAEAPDYRGSQFAGSRTRHGCDSRGSQLSRLQFSHDRTGRDRNSADPQLTRRWSRLAGLQLFRGRLEELQLSETWTARSNFWNWDWGLHCRLLAGDTASRRGGWCRWGQR